MWYTEYLRERVVCVKKGAGGGASRTTNRGRFSSSADTTAYY